jgi:hypothetical protein
MAGADPAQWHRAPPPAGTFQCGGLDGWPWFVSAEGRVMRLFRGAAFDEVARIPSLKAAELHALPGGYVLSVPHRRFLRVLRSLDPTNCAIGWRRRGPFAVRGALGDIVLLAPDPADLRTTIAIDAESGAELWNHAVPAGEMVSVVTFETAASSICATPLGNRRPLPRHGLYSRWTTAAFLPPIAQLHRFGSREPQTMA